MAQPATRGGEIWAMEPHALRALLAALQRRPDPEEIQSSARSDRPTVRLAPVAGRGRAVAILPLVGPLTHHVSLVTLLFGGTSTEAFRAAFRQAVADPAVGTVVLDVDSPGGSVFGVEELADTIFQARGAKPIIAVANATAASAAYWIASQADELVVTPSGEVGSIGVLAIHDDLSRAADRFGLKRTFIVSAPGKAEGNPFEPLSSEARAYIQSRVNAYHEAFVRGVARGRRASGAAVRDHMGRGRMVGAEDAVRLGMADRIETLDATIERLARRLARAGAGAVAEASAPAVQTSAADELDRLRRKQRLAEVAVVPPCRAVPAAGVWRGAVADMERKPRKFIAWERC